MRIAFGLLLALAAAWLAWRNFGLHPVIFADEWYYSKMARLTPLAEAIVPSYLYLWLFGATNACGDGFLDCARGINLLFYTAAAPFLYLTARRFTGPGWAAAIALLSMLAPLNLYTMFFMPEAVYYFGFCVLSWVMLAHADRPLPLLAMAGGAVLGAMSLVKVHALFLLPSLCLYLVYASWHAGGAWLWRGLGAAGIAAALALGVKFALGFVLAGDAGLSLLGPFYGNAAGGGSLVDRLVQLLGPAWISARGHLMALAVLLGLPLAALLHGLCSSALRARGTPVNPLLVYVLLMLGAAAGMTAVYAGTVAYAGNNEGLRLHLRYYSFTFPLLLVVAAAVARHERAAPRLRLLAAGLVGAAVVAAVVLLPRYAINPIDGPEIAAIDLRAWGGWAVAALACAVLALWALGQRMAVPLFLFAALPLTLALGGAVTSNYLDQVVNDWVADRAGKAARDHVPAHERHLVTVAGHSVVDIMRAQFHIDARDIGMLELPAGAPIERYQLPVRQPWLLVVGRHALPEGVRPVLQADDHALVRLEPDTRLLATAGLSADYGGASLLAGAEGMSVAEPWGRWSDGKRVVLHFSRPLPPRLDVILKARAYAANTGLPFTMRVGQESHPFRLAGSFQEIHLRFATDGLQRSLEIVVPQPTAPRSLGEWPDDRELGIAIAEIAVGTHAMEAATKTATP